MTNPPMPQICRSIFTLIVSSAVAVADSPAAPGWRSDCERLEGSVVQTVDQAPESGPERSAWLSLVAALESGYEPTMDDMEGIAAALADGPEEVLIVWDRDGHFLTYTVGNSHEVRMPRRQIHQLEGGIAIHNHPRGLDPSARDFEAVRRLGVKRLYVAARINGVVSLTTIDRANALRFHDPIWHPVVVDPEPAIGAETASVATQLAYDFLARWIS